MPKLKVPTAEKAGAPKQASPRHPLLPLRPKGRALQMKPRVKLPNSRLTDYLKGRVRAHNGLSAVRSFCDTFGSSDDEVKCPNHVVCGQIDA